MSLVVYPTESFDSWCTLEEADTYFANRLRGATWDSNEDDQKEAALKQAFIRINLLDLSYPVPILDETLKLLKQSQMEQAVHELRYDLDSVGSSLSAVDLDGVKVNWKQSEIKPYPEIVISLLRKYIKLKTVRLYR